MLTTLIKQSFGQAVLPAESDGELLRRFVSRQDGDAFAALFRRHGAMVHGVCRRVLGNVADAETPARPSSWSSPDTAGPSDGEATSGPGSSASPAVSPCRPCGVVAGVWNENETRWQEP